MKALSFYFLAIFFALDVLHVPAQPVNGSSESTLVTNQFVHQNLHLPEIRLHDPWILAHAPTKTYYLYTSNTGRATGVNRPGTMAYRSKDLLNWEGPIVVFALPEGTWASTNQGAWAPEVHQYKGRFYL